MFFTVPVRPFRPNNGDAVSTQGNLVRSTSFKRRGRRSTKARKAEALETVIAPVVKAASPRKQQLRERVRRARKANSVAAVADETGELGRLFARLHECAGDAVSMQRAAPSFEERRVEIHVRGDHAAALHE